MSRHYVVLLYIVYAFMCIVCIVRIVCCGMENIILCIIYCVLTGVLTPVEKREGIATLAFLLTGMQALFTLREIVRASTLVCA